MCDDLQVKIFFKNINYYENIAIYYIIKLKCPFVCVFVCTPPFSDTTVGPRLNFAGGLI